MKRQGSKEWEGVIARFLAGLPSQRSATQVLSGCLEAVGQALPNTSGLALYGREAPIEVRWGHCPEGCLAWAQQARAQLAAGAAGHLRSSVGGYWCLGFPLPEGDLLVGLLAFWRPRPFSAPQKEKLITLAQGTSAALANLAELGRAQHRLEKLSLLYHIGKAMNALLDVRKLLDEIMHRGQETLGAEACSVLLVDEDRQELYFEIAKGEVGKALEQVRMPINQGIAGWIATHGEPLIVNDVGKDPRFYAQMDRQVAFTTRSIIGVPLLARGKTIGVIEVLNKRDDQGFTPEDVELLTALAADAAISIDNARLFQAVLDGYIDTIKALANSVEAKDPYTAGHIDRVSNYSLETAHVLGLPEEEIEALRYGSILHDVGKIGIDDAILRKPAGLTEEERATMSTHTVIGSHIVEHIRFLQRARPIIRHHHEDFDGSGYPEGLAGEAIPIGARIVNVVDAFDAMTTDRPYRKALTPEFAAGELRKKAGTQFDPRVVEAFIRVLKDRSQLS